MLPGNQPSESCDCPRMPHTSLLHCLPPRMGGSLPDTYSQFTVLLEKVLLLLLLSPQNWHYPRRCYGEPHDFPVPTPLGQDTLGHIRAQHREGLKCHSSWAGILLLGTQDPTELGLGDKLTSQHPGASWAWGSWGPPTGGYRVPANNQLQDVTSLSQEWHSQAAVKIPCANVVDL